MSHSQSNECKIHEIYGITPWSYIAIIAAQFISIASLWRILFTRLIGKPCGAHYAALQCGKLVKPSLVIQTESDGQNRWKINSLNYFYKENIFQNGKYIDTESIDKKLEFLKTSLNCSLSEIEEYFQYLKQEKKYQECCNKFSEEFWKCITMLFLTIYGSLVIYDADYFYNTQLLYMQWPQAFNEGMELYYKFSLGYHGHRALWQCFDAKRKDFWAMIIHHWVTILLIIGSWHLGVMQFGCIVMFCHDNSDFLLATAKVFLYNEWRKCSNIFYALFVISWIVFRIVLFSWKVLYSIYTESVNVYDCHWLHPAFTAGLTILLILHFYWLQLILTAGYNACKTNKLRDERSDDEQSQDIAEVKKDE